MPYKNRTVTLEKSKQKQRTFRTEIIHKFINSLPIKEQSSREPRNASQVAGNITSRSIRQSPIDEVSTDDIAPDYEEEERSEKSVEQE